VAIVRGGYEFQGQKCSAVSRVYIPRSLWNDVRGRLVAMIDEITMGDIRDFTHFMGAVIDRRAFDKISGYIDAARGSAMVLAGGECDASKGYFIRPTLVETTDPSHRLLREEVFGPVVTAYVYDDGKWRETLALVDSTSPYALTGAVFAQDRRAIVEATGALRYAAGNFYINDKPTGAVVGQQPFGGARMSGTNDKAGSALNMMRWVSPRVIKETFVPPVEWRYPHQDPD
jgi:1-pyrroline-5-carboxylate dehydrogenase